MIFAVRPLRVNTKREKLKLDRANAITIIKEAVPSSKNRLVSVEARSVMYIGLCFVVTK